MKEIISIALCMLLCVVFAGVGSAQSHIYDNAEIVEHPLNGKISIASAPEKSCTLEALNDWYYNYILETDYDQYMVFYSDASSDKGVYGTKEGVEMTVSFAKDSKGWYVGSEKFAVWYFPSGEDGLILSIGC